MESEVANTLPARHDSIFRHIGKRINEIKRAKASGIRTDLAKMPFCITIARKSNCSGNILHHLLRLALVQHTFYRHLEFLLCCQKPN